MYHHRMHGCREEHDQAGRTTQQVGWAGGPGEQLQKLEFQNVATSIDTGLYLGYKVYRCSVSTASGCKSRKAFGHASAEK